jgi:hypothetical protein
LCRKIDEAKIAALLFAPLLPCSPFLSSSLLPSSAQVLQTTLPQFHTAQRIPAINSYCIELFICLQLQPLGLIARQPCLAHDRVLQSRLSQSSPATTTRQNYNTLLIDCVYTKIADLLE